MISVFVEDSKTIRIAWEMSWPLGKLVTFATPEAFWSHVDANPFFLDSLCCVVTDLNFGDRSVIDGSDFAHQLKQRTRHLPVLVASHRDVCVSDFAGAVDGILPKAPPDGATLQKYLKKEL